ILRFAPTWKPQPAPVAPAAGRVVLLGATPKVVASLRGRSGHPLTSVCSGARFARTGPGDYEIDPTSQSDWTRLFDDLGPRDPFVRIVVATDGGGETAAPEAALDLSAHARSATLLLRALMSSAGKRRVVVTYVIPESTANPSPHLAALSGLAKTLRHEHP